MFLIDCFGDDHKIFISSILHIFDKSLFLFFSFFCFFSSKTPKFPQWNKINSVHLDDLATNFCLNPRNGLKCSAFYRTKPNAQADCELLLWAKYLELLAGDVDVTMRDHQRWMTTLQEEAEKKK